MPNSRLYSPPLWFAALSFELEEAEDGFGVSVSGWPEGLPRADSRRLVSLATPPKFGEADWAKRTGVSRVCSGSANSWCCVALRAESVIVATGVGGDSAICANRLINIRHLACVSRFRDKRVGTTT